MCLILLAHQADPELPLVLLANRDEFYARPTAPLGYWPGIPNLVAGRDLVSGGTWLGMRGPRWAAVTNVREGHAQHLAGDRSRGWLVRDYLADDCRAADFIDRLVPVASRYPGFNLLLGDRSGSYYVSNRGEPPRVLSPGFYGLSNAGLDTPWPKVLAGRQRLQEWLAGPGRQPATALALLAATGRAPDAALPATGVPLAWERALSAIFIQTPAYGTRCTSLLLRSRDGSQQLIERVYHGDPARWTERRLAAAAGSECGFSGGP